MRDLSREEWRCKAITSGYPADKQSFSSALEESQKTIWNHIETVLENCNMSLRLKILKISGSLTRLPPWLIRKPRLYLISNKTPSHRKIDATVKLRHYEDIGGKNDPTASASDAIYPWRGTDKAAILGLCKFQQSMTIHQSFSTIPSQDLFQYSMSYLDSARLLHFSSTFGC